MNILRPLHAFITSRIDGCNTVLAGSPRTITDRLQRLLNAAALVISNTGKFDRGLTHLLHSELHWLDVPQRILHKLGVTVHRCLQGKAPQYLVNCCHPTSDVASRQRLRPSSRHHLVIPRHRCSTLGRQCYDTVGWNLGHVTRKIVSEITYNVWSGTLNPTIPYHVAVIFFYNLR